MSDTNCTWQMYAHRYDSGRFHTVGSERYVRNHMLGQPIIKVRVEEVPDGDETGNAWGWMGFAYLHYEADTEPQMIWCTRGQFEMCFTYGSAAEVERGKGRVVRLRITAAEEHTPMPERIQLKRTAGWRMPEGAVRVDRATIWGNPFKVGEPISRDSELWPYVERVLPGLDSGSGASAIDRIPFTAVTLTRAEDVVAAYSWWVIEQPALMLRMVDELGGRDLACWCKLPIGSEPDICHAANLLELVAELEAPDA